MENQQPRDKASFVARLVNSLRCWYGNGYAGLRRFPSKVRQQCSGSSSSTLKSYLAIFKKGVRPSVIPTGVKDLAICEFAIDVCHRAQPGNQFHFCSGQTAW